MVRKILAVASSHKSKLTVILQQMAISKADFGAGVGRQREKLLHTALCSSLQGDNNSNMV